MYFWNVIKLPAYYVYKINTIYMFTDIQHGYDYTWNAVT